MGEGAAAEAATDTTPRTRAAVPAFAPLEVPGVEFRQSRELAIRRDSLFRRWLAAADATAVCVAMLGSYAALGDHSFRPLALVVPFALVLVAKAAGLYDRDEHLLHRTTLDEIPALFGLAAVFALLTSLAGTPLMGGQPSSAEVALCWLVLLVLLISLRATTRALVGRHVPVERCLFIGDEENAAELATKLTGSRSVSAELAGWLPFSARRSTDDPRERGTVIEQVLALIDAQQVQRVILGPGVPEDAIEELRRARSGAKVSVLPQLSRLVQSSTELDRLNGITLLGLRPFEITTSSRLIKRGFDIVGSALGLLLTAPLMAIVAIAIRIDSGGPILFRHLRAGRHGERFEMLKFRSMVDGAEEQKEALRHMNEAEGVFKIADDPRITKVGGLLRRAHIDELPQLVNVLRGEMSLVGPRPLPLDEDAQIVGWHRRRLDLRPGITGPWQILGSARTPMPEMLKLDYQYVANWSLWNDVRILFLTVPRVLGRGGM